MSKASSTTSVYGAKGYGKGYGSSNAKRVSGYSGMSVDSLSIRPKISTGCYMGPPITAVAINKSLLTPLNLDIDPAIQAVRTQEKNQIKTLNNRFASYIDKVRLLEQQNKMLETKWNLLESQTTAPSSIEPLFKNYIASLQMQLQQIENDKNRLDMENINMHRTVEEQKAKYEEEINRRNAAENEFVFLKKDVDSGYLSKVDLEDRVSGLMDEVNFLKAIYNEELRELQADMKNTSVVVQMDNSRALDMSQTIDEVRAQYEGVAARSREEAESWYKTKFDQMSAQAGKYGEELRNNKSEIAELNRMIARLQSEIATVKGQCSSLEGHIIEAEERGEQAVRDARGRIRDLELALQKAKQDMARQLKDYQELMNIKLALDIEISTYKKLLEGEEDRIGHQAITNIQNVHNYSPMVTSCTFEPTRKAPSVIIKMVETQDSSTSYN